MTACLRLVAGPFVAAAPAGARVRTRLRVTAQDEAVLRAAGVHLGSLAGTDLAARCAEGRLDAKGRAVSRARRKRALTAESSSRWAGAITRASEDQWGLAERNLRAEQASLHARIGRIQARLAVPAGGRAGRTRGYATAAERHAKTVRLQSLKARLARVQRQADSGAVSVVRGGRALLRRRGNLDRAGLTEQQWRQEWESARLFLTVDGDEEVAAQAATAAIRYDISHDPARGRWYIDASWTTAPAPAASLDGLRQHPVVALDVNHGHLAVAVIAPDGNVLGTPATPGLDLAGLPAATRDGHLRAAITSIIDTARACGARAIVIGNLNFAQARAEGRERDGSRPSRGRRGRSFRRAVAGILTARVRDRLVQTAPAEAARPAQARPGTTPAAGTAPRKPAIPRGPRQPPGTETGRPHRTTAGNQAAHDRSGPPAGQDHVLLAQ